MKKILLITTALLGFTVVNLQAQTGAEKKPKVEKAHVKEGPATGPEAPHHPPHVEEHPAPPRASDEHSAPPAPAEHPAPAKPAHSHDGHDHPHGAGDGHEGHQHPPGVEHAPKEAPKEKSSSKK